MAMIQMVLPKLKGSPEIEVIRKTQAIMREGESSPEIAKLNPDLRSFSGQSMTSKNGCVTGGLYERN